MENKGRYRLIISLLIFLFMYILVLFVKQTDVIAVISNIFTGTMIEKSMPVYSYISNIDNNVETGVIGGIVNSIYPLNEYLMAAETSGINVTSETFDYKENETQSSEEEKKAQEGESTAENEEQSVETEETTDVISRDVVNGNVYTKAQLSNFDFIKRFYTVTSITSLTADIFNPQVLLDKNLSMVQDNSKPQILIFHTHSQETFIDSKDSSENMSIVGVGSYLEKLLEEKYGYNVIHDKSVYDYIDGKLDRSKAYTYAEEGIRKILNENPSIEVVIDLHRDGVNENTKLITDIDGKKVAKVMLFNGISYSKMNGNITYLNNPNREENLAMSLQMKLLGEAYYPEYFRNNYINAYRYCLHLRGKSILVEAGAQTNTFEEVKNAMEPLADILNKVFKGEKAYLFNKRRRI